MEDRGIQRSWKDIFESVCEKKPPMLLNILDTIAFDRLSVTRPMYWLHTSAEGYLLCRNIRNMTVDEVIQVTIATAPSAVVKAAKYLTSLEDSKEILAVGISDNVRFTLNAKAIVSLPALISAGLDGLVLTKSVGKKFDRRVFIHEVKVTDSVYEDTIRVRSLYDMSQEEPGCEEDVRLKIKFASVRLIERLLITTKLGLRRLALLYRFEVLKREIWLLGLDDCVLVKIGHALEPKMQRNAMSVMSLMVSPDMKPTHSSPTLPRPASRFYRHLQKKPNAPQAKSKLYAWGHASGNTFLLDSTVGKPFRSLNQSRVATPKVEQRMEARSVTRMLKTNESAFLDAEFKQNTVTLKRISKLNKSFNGKTLSRDPPGLEDAYAPAYQNRKCCGKYCHEDVSIPPTFYSRGARFLIDQELITQHSTLQFQALHPVKTIFPQPQKALAEITPSLSIGKLVARGESAFLPVCLKCFLTYEKMKHIGVGVQASLGDLMT